MNNQERKIELQRLRNLANSQWEAKSIELNIMWGAVRFLDEQIALVEKTIKDEEIRKREAELSVAKANEPESSTTNWVKEGIEEGIEEPIPQKEAFTVKPKYPKTGNVLR